MAFLLPSAEPTAPSSAAPAPFHAPPPSPCQSGGRSRWEQTASSSSPADTSSPVITHRLTGVDTDAGSGVTRSHLRRDALGGFDADAGVPFAWRQHRDLVQELVDAGEQVVPVLRLIGYVVENLQMEQRRLRKRLICTSYSD